MSVVNGCKVQSSLGRGWMVWCVAETKSCLNQLVFVFFEFLWTAGGQAHSRALIMWRPWLKSPDAIVNSLSADGYRVLLALVRLFLSLRRSVVSLFCLLKIADKSKREMNDICGHASVPYWISVWFTGVRVRSRIQRDAAHQLRSK